MKGTKNNVHIIINEIIPCFGTKRISLLIPSFSKPNRTF